MKEQGQAESDHIGQGNAQQRKRQRIEQRLKQLFRGEKVGGHDPEQQPTYFRPRINGRNFEIRKPQTTNGNRRKDQTSPCHGRPMTNNRRAGPHFVSVARGQ